MDIISTVYLDEKANAINFLKDQISTNVIEIGRHLSEARSLCAHGEWEKWVEEKCDFKKSQADSYIRVFRKYENVHSSARLDITKLKLLAQLPDDIEPEKFIEQNDVESKSVRELKALIQSATVTDSEKQQIANEAYNKARYESTEEIEKIKKEHRSILNQYNDSQKHIADQEKHIKQLQQTSKDESEIRKFKSELENLKDKRKNLYSEIQEIKKLVHIKLKAQEILTEISPIKYMSELEPKNVSKIAIETFQIIINTFEKWIVDANKIMNKARTRYE